MLANFYIRLLTQPTRIHGNSCLSLIDDIFINSLECEAESGNLIEDISDHLPNFTFLVNRTIKKGKDHNLTGVYLSLNSERYIADFSNLSPVYTTTFNLG